MWLCLLQVSRVRRGVGGVLRQYVFRWRWLRGVHFPCCLKYVCTHGWYASDLSLSLSLSLSPSLPLQVFLRDWFAERSVTNLRALRGKGGSTAKQHAVKANEQFIRAERVDMRERLLIAARAGHLRWSNARVGAFVLCPAQSGHVDLLSSEDE